MAWNAPRLWKSEIVPTDALNKLVFDVQFLVTKKSLRLLDPNGQNGSQVFHLLLPFYDPSCKRRVAI